MIIEGRRKVRLEQSLGTCQLCGKHSSVISSGLGVCLKCIIEREEEALRISGRAHEKSRSGFGLPGIPPREAGGLACGVCSNECRIGTNELGYCGLVLNSDGRIVRRGGTPDRGVLQWYYDPLPSNCVAWWFCPGCTGMGYPKYSYKRGAETGYTNLAVFYGACSFDCLYCQNWHYRSLASEAKPLVSAEDLSSKVTKQVSCICYFGGDPSVQMPHALRTSRIALESAQRERRILRICWETNGYWSEKLALEAAELSLASGGNIKFDLKTWNDSLSIALCGVSNAPTLQSFKLIGRKFSRERMEPRVLTASTLLIPGYVGVDEVRNISGFISEIDPEIPYTLLAFYPRFVMSDLPTTSRKLAEACYDEAKSCLENVRVGNIHLLS